jgi:hypothetical protein
VIRAKLTLARRCTPQRTPLSLVKKALRLYKGKGIAKAVYRRNAMAWLVAHQRLGDKHILRKGVPAKWGVPGEPGVPQVFAPRRIGGAL